MKKSAYMPKELSPFKYEVPGVRLPSFNDKQLDRKTGKPITVSQPVLFRVVGITLILSLFVSGFLLAVFFTSHFLKILFSVFIIGIILYSLFGNLLFRWEPDLLPEREIPETKPDRPTGRKTTTERKDK